MHLVLTGKHSSRIHTACFYAFVGGRGMISLPNWSHVFSAGMMSFPVWSHVLSKGCIILEGYGPEGEDVWSQGRMALRPLWWTDKHLWKHYLSATSFEDGKFWRPWKLSIFRKLRDMPGTNHIWQLNLTTKDSPQLIQKQKQKCLGVPLNVIVVFDFAHPCFIMIFKYLTDNLVAHLLSHKWVGFHALLHLSRRVSV